METTQTQVRYVEWLSPEEMHKASQSWLSELQFIKDEHLFFEDLIKLQKDMSDELDLEYIYKKNWVL